MTTTTTSGQFSPWPYAIVGYFILFVTGVAVFITWAVTQDMDLVRKDYYDHEILFQQQIDRQRRTAELGAQGMIHFYRPSDAKLDHHLRLAPGTNGTQQIDATNRRAGLWKIAVQWTVDGKEYFLERALVIGG